MKSRKPQWVKVMVDWAERELTAVIAVAVVLTFIFSQSLASDEQTAGSLVSNSTGSAIVSQQVQSTVWPTGTNMIKFGTDLSGVSDSSAVYTGTWINIGTALFTPSGGSVTINTTPGQYRLKVTAQDGSVTLGGVKFSFTGFSATTKAVTLNSQTTINVTANTKVYSIEAVQSADEDLSPDAGSTGDSGSDSLIVPISSISLLPNARNMYLGTSGSSTFVVVTKNSLNAIVTGVPLAWLSSDPSIASVDEAGVVTPHKAGSVTITATVAGSTLKASSSVTVLLPVSAPTMDVTPKEQPSDNTGSTLLDDLINNLTGNNEPAEVPTTGGTEDSTAQDALDKLAEDATTGATDDTTSKAVSESTESALDAFAQQEAKNYAETGTTAVTQAQISNIVQKQTGVVAKVATRISLAAKQMANTFTEIFAGRTITVGDQKIKKPSIWTIIGNFIKGKTTGAGATDTGTLGTNYGDDEID